MPPPVVSTEVEKPCSEITRSGCTQVRKRAIAADSGSLSARGPLSAMRRNLFGKLRLRSTPWFVRRRPTAPPSGFIVRTVQIVYAARDDLFEPGFFAGFPHPRFSATGCDFAGEVEAVGEGVLDVAVGDRVYGLNRPGAAQLTRRASPPTPVAS